MDSLGLKLILSGAPTYLVSPVDFASNPQSLFLTLSRYKIKDTYATSQMLDHAINTMPGKGFTLHELKNLMISAEGRPRVDVCKSKISYEDGMVAKLGSQFKRSAYISRAPDSTGPLSTLSTRMF